MSKTVQTIYQKVIFPEDLAMRVVKTSFFIVRFGFFGSVRFVRFGSVRFLNVRFRFGSAKVRFGRPLELWNSEAKVR